MLTFLSSTLADAGDIFGQVKPPVGVSAYDTAAGGIGLVLFLSRIIRLVTIVGGLFVMVNLIYSGWLFISSSGDIGKTTQAVNNIVYSLIGLVVIVGSYAIAGILGMIFFGDATYIINPVICGPDGCGG